MSTPIQPVPPLVLASEFPSLADRPAGTYNAKAKAWADSENAMAQSVRDIAVVTHDTAVAAREAADEAVPAAVTAVSARDTALVYRDSAWAAAAAVQTSAGLPEPLVPGKVLGALSESSVGWVDASRPGDIIHCAQAPSSGWLPCDGSIYMKSSYPALAAALGDVPRVEQFVELPGPGFDTNPTDSDISISDHLAIAYDTALKIYKRSGDTFNYLTEFSGSHGPLSFNPDGSMLAVGRGLYITIYNRSGDTFTPNDLPNLLTSGSISAVKFSPDGAYLYVGVSVSPWIKIYKVVGTTFTLLANPAELPIATVSKIATSSDGKYIAVNNGTTGAIGYERSGDVFTKLPAALSSLPNNTLFEFLPGGKTLVFSLTTGDIASAKIDALGEILNVSNNRSSVGASSFFLTPSGDRVIVCSSSFGIDVYELNNGAMIAMNNVIRGRATSLRKILFTSDGQMFFAQTAGSSVPSLFGISYDSSSQFQVPEILSESGMPAFIKA